MSGHDDGSSLGLLDPADADLARRLQDALHREHVVIDDPAAVRVAQALNGTDPVVLGNLNRPYA